LRRRSTDGIFHGFGSVMVKSGIVLICDDAEDGGIGAYSQRERNCRAREESWTATQRTRGVDEILPQVGQPSRAMDVTQVFLNLRRGAT
jgi:hypothetical protein